MLLSSLTKLLPTLEMLMIKEQGTLLVQRKACISFSWAFLTTPGKSFHTALVVDGTVITYTYLNAEEHSKADLSSSNSAVVKLKSGNKVWLRAHGTSGQHAHADWSSFSGFKV